MNYYNDNDPFAAKWLRCLIRDGLIPDGDVDERPIQNVEPEDLKHYTQCHFFAGIGGWSRALRIAGWPTDEPVWTGSCPCQPLSIAGKQQGEKDERHLWPEFYRLISQCRPIRIFGEQSESPDGIEWLDGVSLDLEEIGYAVGSVDLPSAGVGAPNKRQRAWWVAHTNGKGSSSEQIISKQKGCADTTRASSYGYRVADSKCAGRQRGNRSSFKRVRNAIERCSVDGGLANSSSKRRQQDAGGTSCDEKEDWGARRYSFEPDGNHKSSGFGTDNRLASTNGNGCDKGGESVGPARNDGTHGNGLQFWDQYRIIGGRDGKSRRIPLEPALFPLAPRVPGRVGLLRGAGNAINPWVAAEFIRSYMDISNPLGI